MTKTENQIVQNLLTAVNDLRTICAFAELQIAKAHKIPVIDNEDYADIVQGYTDRIHEIVRDMYDLGKGLKRRDET